MLYDPFIDLDDGMQPVAMLAKSWVSNAAGTEWTFHLREGVTFHDGSPLTADDVVYTYRHLLDPATRSPGAGEFGTMHPENFQAVDASTVKVTLSTPDFELPVVLASKFAWSRTAPQDQLCTIPSGPGHSISASPRRGQVCADAQSALLARGPAEAELHRLTGIQDPLAYLGNSVWRSRCCDSGRNATAPRCRQSEGHGGSCAGRHVCDHGMFIDTPPFTDVRVRQALRTRSRSRRDGKTALLGLARGNDNPIPPSSPDAYRTI